MQMPSGSAMGGMAMGAGAPAHGMAMGGMAMGGGSAGPDLNDVKYDRLPRQRPHAWRPGGDRGRAGRDGSVACHNSSSMSAYHLDLGALDGELIAVDGFRVQPIVGPRFPITVAQRLIIRLRIPRAPGAHPILAVFGG